jgi:hypothetical protein
MSKGEVIVELREKDTTTTIKDITPAGVRLELNLKGEVKGKFNAAHLETPSVLLKPDGTREWEAKAIEVTRDGDQVIVTMKGTARQGTPTVVRFEGEASFQTASKKLAWLNTMKGWVEGTNDISTGEATGKVYAKN